MTRTPHPLSHIPLQHLKDVTKFLRDIVAPEGDYLPPVDYDNPAAFASACQRSVGYRVVVRSLEGIIERIEREHTTRPPSP